MLKPKTESELAEAVASAKGPLRIYGGGTRNYGRPVDGDALSVGGISGIRLYEPGALTLVAAAGTPLAEIDKALAEEGQMLAFEPMDHRGLLGSTGSPTIGALAAANISGPRRVSMVGASRDHLLGVQFVDGAGTVLKNGGRVMKNVTGYDLVKLMAGSHGTLGVLTEVSYKVLPVPETQATLRLPDLSEADGVAAMSVALGSPFEVTGAAQGLHPAGGKAPVLLRIEGFEASVKYRLGRLTDLLARFGPAEHVTDPADSAAHWRDVRDVTGFNGHGFVARLSIKPTDYPDLCGHIANVAEAAQVLADWGGGLVWVAASVDDQTGRAFLDRLHTFARLRGGHATLIKGSGGLRRSGPSFQPQSTSVALLSKALRAKFDPKGILNPGLMD